MPGAVSLSLDPNGEPVSFYADGVEYYMINNMGYDGDLELAMIPESFRTEILREEADENKVLVENCNAETQTVKARPLASGYVKAKTGDATTAAVYDAWYQTVYLPKSKTEPAEPANMALNQDGARSSVMKPQAKEGTEK